jgi:hypothetical protein
MRRALTPVLLLVLSSPALGYEAVPAHSFAKPTANGKHVLVMLQQHALPGDKALKEKYGRSGLYPVGDPTKPAWTCDWVAMWDRNVFASDDGVFAVRVVDTDPAGRHWVLSYEKKIPPKKPGWADDPALLIYENGKPSRTLALKEVFGTSAFTDRDCYMGPIVAIDAFDDAGGRVVISTEANGRKRTATVAFRTGEVVERSSAGSLAGGGGISDLLDGDGRSWGRMLLLGLLVVGVLTAAFAGAAVLLIRNQRTRKV